MHRASRMASGLLALALVTSGCYGPFSLTRKLHTWNGQVGAKWEREFMFIVLAWLPVYGIAVLGDAIVFNSMEFWTGKNPIDSASMNSNESRTKRLVRGDKEVRLTYLPTSDAGQLLIEQFQHGQSVGALHLEQRDGMTVGSDTAGHVLFTAQTLPNGSVLVHDATGKQIASYTPEEAKRVLRQ